jgi:glutamyl-tRNA synthetase
MTLGWAPKGDTEIVPWERIEAEFRLEDVTRAPAFFDEKKLTAFNKEYLKALPPEAFVAACEPWLPEHYDRATFAEIAPLLQSRVGTLAEAPVLVDFLFAEPDADEASWTKAMRPEWAGELLDQVIKAYQVAPWDAETLKTEWRRIVDSLGVKPKLADGPVRVAVTGRTVGPPLFESVELLGREETLRRLEAARERLGG